MIPDFLNKKIFFNEYTKDIQDNEFLMKECKIIEDVEYILSALEEDEDITYDEEYINEIIDLIVSSVKKIALEKLQNNTDCYNILFDISTKYMEIAQNLMQSDIPTEEKHAAMYRELSALCDNLLAEYSQKAMEKEMYAIQHPIISLIKKFILPLIITGVILLVVMTILVAYGTIEVADFIKFIPFAIIFGLFFVSICILLKFAVFNGDKQ